MDHLILNIYLSIYMYITSLNKSQAWHIDGTSNKKYIPSNLNPIRLLVYKSQLSEATVANFHNNGKYEFHVLIKHCFLMVKILFKLNNGLISVIRSLICRKQRLRGGMLTLNAVVPTQKLNTQIAQIRQLSRKTQTKKSTNSFWLIVYWSYMIW